MKEFKTYLSNKLTIQLLLIVYVFGNLNTLVPVAKDAFSHLFFEKIHIASVHLENGRYHLHLEVKNQIDKTEKNQSEKTNTYDSLNAHILSDYLTITEPATTSIEFNDNYINSFSEFYIKPQSPPPKNLD